MQKEPGQATALPAGGVQPLDPSDLPSALGDPGAVVSQGQ